MHSYMLGLGGWHEETLEGAERAIGLDAESFLPQWNLVRAHAWLGHHEDAIAVSSTILTESGRHQWVLGQLAWTYAKAGLLEEARAVHDEMEGRSRHEFVSPFWDSLREHPRFGSIVGPLWEGARP
jgi:hypothetical protein